MHTQESNEDKKILLLLAEGSEYAFQLIFDRHRNRVYKLAILYVKSPAIAEDIVQDVFLKIWFQRKTLTPILSLESWIYTLARNQTLNYLKKLSNEWNARDKWAAKNTGSEDATDHRIRGKECQHLLAQAIGQLTLQQQNVYRLAKDEGLSYEAIAHKLSLSSLTVKTHMANALQSIRRFIEVHDKDLLIILIIGQNFF